jgi:hypothetical protein
MPFFKWSVVKIQDSCCFWNNGLQITFRKEIELCPTTSSDARTAIRNILYPYPCKKGRRKNLSALNAVAVRASPFLAVFLQKLPKKAESAF